MIGDDYGDKIWEKIKEYYKTIDNDYFSRDKFRKICRAELMIDDAIIAKKAMIDWIEQKPFIDVFTERGLMDQLYIIIVYTSLSNLARNLESRRKEGDLRGVFAFNQFSERYIKAEIGDNILDFVNRVQFRQILLDKFKYEFKDENELNSFCDKIFSEMSITDDENHGIKLKPEYRVDYLLNTNGKTKEDIYEELKNIFEL